MNFNSKAVGRLSGIEMNVARCIVYHYLDKYDNNYPDANRAIKELGITRIVYSEKESQVEIWLSRPGLFIGVRGENYDKIKARIHDEVKLPITIRIIEDNLNNALEAIDCSD